MKLKRECENSREDNGERRPLDSAKPKSLIKSVESGGKTRGVKKVSLCDDNNMKKIKETTYFLCKKSSNQVCVFH